MGDVVRFPLEQMKPLSPDEVLRAARSEEFDHVIVIGRTKACENYFAVSTADDAMNNWLADRFKAFLLAHDE